MFHWLSVARCYSEDHYMVDMLRQAGLSDGKWDGPFNMQLSRMILEILLRRVIPSAMADEMDWWIKQD